MKALSQKAKHRRWAEAHLPAILSMLAEGDSEGEICDMMAAAYLRELQERGKKNEKR